MKPVSKEEIQRRKQYYQDNKEVLKQYQKDRYKRIKKNKKKDD